MHENQDYTLISLELPKTGFKEFISCWLLNSAKGALLVDPGPARSIPYLLETLAARGIQRIEGVLLTHIHIDHAGGIGQLVEGIPVGWICAHPRAHKHLIDPTRLWEGSRKVLGDLADFYGPILPVPKELIRFEESIDLSNEEAITVVETPGHAPHHISFFWRTYAFVGESIGVRYPFDGQLYIRPATPPRFIPDVFLNSIERLASHPLLPSNACFGHYGLEADAKQWIQHGQEQTQLWMKVVQENISESLDGIHLALQQRDDRFALFSKLPLELQERERIFINNSIRGMRNYFQKASNQS